MRPTRAALFAAGADRLSDEFAPDLEIVFCGINPPSTASQ
jgi:hypothetical protein